MKRTSVVTILIVAIVGAASAALTQVGLAASGRPIINPPVTLPLALAAIGAIIVTLAVPIRRMTRGAAKGPVDPFYATRVVTLAKASALSGALLTGAAAALIVYLLTRSVMPGVGSVGPAIAAAVGAAVLLTCGLIAEAMCRIPPRDENEDDDDQRPIRVHT